MLSWGGGLKICYRYCELRPCRGRNGWQEFWHAKGFLLPSSFSPCPSLRWLPSSLRVGEVGPITPTQGLKGSETTILGLERLFESMPYPHSLARPSVGSPGSQCCCLPVVASLHSKGVRDTGWPGRLIGFACRGMSAQGSGNQAVPAWGTGWRRTEGVAGLARADWARGQRTRPGRGGHAQGPHCPHTWNGPHGQGIGWGW